MLDSSLVPIAIMCLQAKHNYLCILRGPGSQYGSFSFSEALYSETLRSTHGPPEQCGQALIVYFA
jgi:hypothetical protein